jgi:hypothetical protein
VDDLKETRWWKVKQEALVRNLRTARFGRCYELVVRHTQRNDDDDDDDDLSRLRTSQCSNDPQHPNCTSLFASITSFT